MKIYADVVFIINFIMDAFIFLVVSKLTRRKPGPVRLLAGSFIMALMYCAMIFFAPFRIYINIFASAVIIMIGVVITFRPNKVKEFLKLIFLSHITAFAMGGMGIALFYFTNISDVVGNIAGYTVNNFPFKILLASSCTFYILIKLFTSWYNRRIFKKQAFYPVKIYFEEADVLLTALLDTGNSLHDPLSKAPVIIAEFNTVKEFLPDSLKLLFYENRENELSDAIGNISGSSFSHRLRLIPFESIGKQNGMLLGFRPDKVEILQEENTITLDEVVIGIYNFKFSNDNAYQGLLNPELIIGRAQEVT